MTLCRKCNGTGEYLGLGFMMTSCDVCYEKSSPNVPIDKKSDAYKTAIKDIMKVHPGISRTEAVKIFNKTYDEL